MRGLDTNILVRYFTEDDPNQSQKVAEMLAETRQSGGRLYITPVVLCETLWSLRGKPYLLKRESLTVVVETLVRDELFVIQDRDLVQKALEDYRKGKADFADYLLGWQNWKAGCQDTLTFDDGLSGHQNFSVLLSS